MEQVTAGDTGNHDQSEPDFHSQVKQKLKKAILLKDYALSKNFDVPAEVVNKLNKAARADNAELEDFADDIDMSIKSLTALTYPATIETVSSKKTGDAVRRFMRVLRFVGVNSLICAALSAGLLRSAAKYPLPPWFLWILPGILAAALGLLGCLTYIYFNVIGLLTEKAFNIEDTEANNVRLFLGLMLGWIFYFFFCRDAFEALIPGSALSGSVGKSQPLLLLLPFLVGFSTRLVVGILNQAIRAAELTLGLESKSAQLAQRKTTRAINTS